MCYVYGIMEKTQNLRKYNNNDIYENNNERYYWQIILHTPPKPRGCLLVFIRSGLDQPDCAKSVRVVNAVE